uniref:HIG1 domain-containing protein n=1 Tax=Bionectria ochroleuca TaxID=29856 RepID=A0A0B7K5F0_BIOOC
MKVISPEEAAAHNAAVRRYALIRNLTLPFRAFLVTSAGTFGFVIKAESASTEFQRAQNPMNFYQDSSQRAAEIIRQNNSAYERFMEWGGENRYKIVFASWMASMAVALAIVNRAPMSTSQKLVQARVYAQGLALVTIKVLDPNDPEHKRIIEKKIHKEEYEGQDLWKDMVEAEERRLAHKAEHQNKA